MSPAMDSASNMLGFDMNTDDPARRAIKVWMRDVMTQKNWTASQWARRAGTSPTNITRFLSPTSSIMPSGNTIAKLARAAGSQPKLNPLHDLNPVKSWQVPIISAQILAGYPPADLWEQALIQMSSHTIAVDGPIDGPAFVVDVPAVGMVGRGISPGDRILVEQVKSGKELAPGNVVLFYHDGTPKLGEWQGQFIVFYPGHNGHDPLFSPVRSSEVSLYGRVRRLIREL